MKHWIANGTLPGTYGDYCPTPESLRARYVEWRHDVLRRLYFRSASKILTVSRFAKWELTDSLGVPADKVVVIHPAADAVFTASIPKGGRCRWSVRGTGSPSGTCCTSGASIHGRT